MTQYDQGPAPEEMTMDNRATLYSIRQIVDGVRLAALAAFQEANDAARNAIDDGEARHAADLANERWHAAGVAYDLADRLWNDACDAHTSGEEGDITITLRRADAVTVADRIRALYHRPAAAPIDLADAAEPMAWLLEPLAVALGQYGPGVRRAPRPTDEERAPPPVRPIDRI